MSVYEVKAGLAEVPHFDVVGVSMETDYNKASEDINALWERFFEERIGQLLPSKFDDTIYAVYSDYEGDHTKPYRLTIGYRMENLEELPSKLHKICVADQTYAVMSAAGSQPQALIETWKAVWSGDLERSFKTDFEIYGPRFFEEGVNEVLVHVGVNL